MVTPRLALWIAIVAACRPSPSAAPRTEPHAESGAPAPKPADVVPTSSLAEIIAGLVPMSPGGEVIALADGGPAITACEQAAWPATLPEPIAAGLQRTPIGSHAVVVHPAGSTEVTVKAIECEAPGDIEGPIAYLRLLQPAPLGAAESREPAAARSGVPGRPHLAVVGAHLARDAALIDPVPVALRDPSAQPLREQLLLRAAEVVAVRRERCEELGESRGVPSAKQLAAALPRAIDAAIVHRILAPAGALAFAVLQHPSLTFDCAGGSTSVGLLLDPDGHAVFELESSAAVELQWLTDLDGDGNQEAVVDVTWMEDGMHDIVLVHRSGQAWRQSVLWSAATP
jgi:hypothetical protein